GIFFILASSICVVGLFRPFWSIVCDEAKEKLRGYYIKRHLKDLAKDEKMILKEYIDSDEATRLYHLNQRGISGLAGRRYVIRTTNISVPGSHSFSFTIDPTVRKVLRKHPHLLS
ncbi:MAG: super-infection exclusion protein B, partial [Pseudomonadota bacterium]